MSFNETDLQRNSIAKRLGALLPQIDLRVKWVDYIPGTAVKTGNALIAIGMENGDVKYVNVSGKSPFKLVNEVLNAMDDYHLEVQFLNKKELQEISQDIASLAKDRAKVADKTLAMLEKSNFSDEECLNIVRKAQAIEIFPSFFPETDGPRGITKETLEKFLKTNAATFIDTQIISDLVRDQTIQKEDNERIEEENCER